MVNEPFIVGYFQGTAQKARDVGLELICISTEFVLRLKGHPELVVCRSTVLDNINHVLKGYEKGREVFGGKEDTTGEIEE